MHDLRTFEKKNVVGATKYNRKLDNTNGRTFYIAAAADLLLKRKRRTYPRGDVWRGTVDSGRKSQQREKKKKKIIWPHVYCHSASSRQQQVKEKKECNNIEAPRHRHTNHKRGGQTHHFLLRLAVGGPNEKKK